MDTASLKQYLSTAYQGPQSFLENIIFPIFGEDSFEDGYETELLETQPELQALAKGSGINSVKQIGTIYIGDPLQIFDITVSDRVLMQRNRVGIQQLIRRAMDVYSSSFMLFHYEDGKRWDWRFTFCQKLGSNNDATDRKRYTFLLGPGQSCRTAADNFVILFNKRGSLMMSDIEHAFSVEALSKEFFDKYKKHYEDIIQFITGKRMVKVANKWEEKVINEPCEEIMHEFASFLDPEKAVRDYVKKLMGRIVFLQFLQKKGWMGVPVNKQWGDGDTEFVQNLFDKSSDKDHFIDGVLEPLFNDLNTERTNDLVSSAVGKGIRVPYLNGGLFERDATDETEFPLPAKYMQSLLDFFASYNFTIDENDPDDAEVGVDPEMLGRIFENLLEDNKDKGAFYTPKEIVSYMCRESLIAYLQTGIEDETTKEAIRQFVTTHDVEALGTNDKFRHQVDDALKDVKICDPAIGSGAFPMGLLKELFLCRTALEGISQHQAAEIKKHIIQQNIYGVDIERGAVDIARLRFWLSLIVDEETPQALPNLDFKIMQGNSLLEQYKGVDLSTITELKTEKHGTYQTTMFDDMIDVLRLDLRKMLEEYYDCTDHHKKQILRAKIIDNVKQQLREQSINVDFSDLDLSGNNQFMLWHTWFYDVFSKGGFDIVIANPPYVDSETMTKNLPELRNRYSDLYQTARGNWDMFIIFIELGMILLKINGVLCKIIPNKLIAAKYGQELRRCIAEKEVIEVRDYSRIDVFTNAAVYPITIIIRNSDNEITSLFSIMDDINRVRQINETPSGSLKEYDNWDLFFTDTKIFNLINKINSYQRLFNMDVDILGAATVADAYEIKKIVEEEDGTNLGFKLINSGTIDPYQPLWGIKTCRYIKGGYLKPVVPKEKLQQYSKTRYEQSNSSKIVVASMTTRYEACLDIGGNYIAGKSTTIILGPLDTLYYYIGIINSKLASFWLKITFNSLKMSGEAINVGRNELGLLPIPNKQVDFKNRINRIIEEKENNPSADTSILESEIDHLIYQLYGLTEEEIKIIEQS